MGSEEIDKFMGWTTVDMGDERLGRARDRVRSDTNSKHVATGKRAKHQEKRDKYAEVRDRRSREPQRRRRGRIQGCCINVNTVFTR